MSIRTDLIEYLQGVCAATVGLEDVKVVKSVRSVDELSVPILTVKTDQYEKLPAAPIRRRQGTFTCTLVSPHSDLDRAEEDLDARLEVLLPALFTFGLNWTTAQQTDLYGRLAFDITVTSIIKNETES